jgi:hypothetical protein
VAKAPYSVRFLQTRGANKSVTYTVPSGYRAVVRCISAVNFSTTESNYALFVAGTAVVFWLSRTAFSTDRADLRIVAYAGEQLKITIEGPDIAVHMSGYLLEDPPAAARAGAGEAGEQLPATPSSSPEAA